MRSGVLFSAVAFTAGMILVLSGCTPAAPVPVPAATPAPKPAAAPAPAPKPVTSAPVPVVAKPAAPAPAATPVPVAPAAAADLNKAVLAQPVPPAPLSKVAAAKPAKPAAPPKPKYKKYEWGDNVLKNAALSDWKKDKPSDWNAYEFKAGEEKQFAVKLGKAKDSGVSLPKPGKDKVVALTQRIEVDKARHGTEVPVTFGVKYKSSAEKQLHLVLRYTVKGKPVYSSQFPLPSKEWTTISKRIMLPAEATEKGVEFFIMRQKGEAGDVQIAEPFFKFGNEVKN